jgi:hypothetical protein
VQTMKSGRSFKLDGTVAALFVAVILATICSIGEMTVEPILNRLRNRNTRGRHVRRKYLT